MVLEEQTEPAFLPWVTPQPHGRPGPRVTSLPCPQTRESTSLEGTGLVAGWTPISGLESSLLLGRGDRHAWALASQGGLIIPFDVMLPF